MDCLLDFLQIADQEDWKAKFKSSSMQSQQAQAAQRKLMDTLARIATQCRFVWFFVFSRFSILTKAFLTVCLFIDFSFCFHSVVPSPSPLLAGSPSSSSSSSSDSSPSSSSSSSRSSPPLVVDQLSDAEHVLRAILSNYQALEDQLRDKSDEITNAKNLIALLEREQSLTRPATVSASSSS